MQQPDYTQVLVSICATSNMHQQNACHFNMVVTLSDLSTGDVVLLTLTYLVNMINSYVNMTCIFST